MKDVDRRRAMEIVLRDSTRRIMTPDEVKLVHEAILTSDPALHDRQGAALSVLMQANNGVVLTWEEANAVAMAIEKIWLSKPAKVIESGSVRDEVATCRRCVCEGSNCPECTACPFDLEATGGTIRNSLSRAPVYVRPAPEPNDCGCSKK